MKTKNVSCACITVKWQIDKLTPGWWACKDCGRRFIPQVITNYSIPALVTPICKEPSEVVVDKWIGTAGEELTNLLEKKGINPATLKTSPVCNEPAEVVADAEKRCENCRKQCNSVFCMPFMTECQINNFCHWQPKPINEEQDINKEYSLSSICPYQIALHQPGDDEVLREILWKIDKRITALEQKGKLTPAPEPAYELNLICKHCQQSLSVHLAQGDRCGENLHTKFEPVSMIAEKPEPTAPTDIVPRGIKSWNELKG